MGKRLTIALVQTLDKLSPQELQSIAGQVGLVMVDEGHRIAAKSFYYPIGNFLLILGTGCQLPRTVQMG